jgi:hypothetical protein
VGTPFNGLFRDKRPGSAPLAGVLLLEQAPRHALREARTLEAVPLLAREIAPPVGLDAVPDDRTLPAMMDLAAGLAAESPLKVLEFLPDEGFWQVIGTMGGPADDRRD